VSVALHYLLAIKAKKYALPMAILQTIAGVIAALINITALTWSIALGKGPLGAQSLMGIDTTGKTAQVAHQASTTVFNIDELNKIATDKGYTDAADLAVKNGFETVQAAKDAGMYRK
jgi:hypothetical protein